MVGCFFFHFSLFNYVKLIFCKFNLIVPFSFSNTVITCVYYYCTPLNSGWIIHASGRSVPAGTVGTSYSLGNRYFIFRINFFVLLSSDLLFICLISFLLFLCARVFWEIVLHEFLVSYSHTEWYLPFSDSTTTSAECVSSRKSINAYALAVLGIIAIIYRDTLSR